MVLPHPPRGRGREKVISPPEREKAHLSPRIRANQTRQLLKQLFTENEVGGRPLGLGADPFLSGWLLVLLTRNCGWLWREVGPSILVQGLALKRYNCEENNLGRWDNSFEELLRKQCIRGGKETSLPRA